MSGLLDGSFQFSALVRVVGPNDSLDEVVPDDVVEGTADRYREIYERITGKAWQ